ncbi:MAG: type 4a pilus biogenesis protein PilO [Patescibacteria group bacterium]
MDSIRKKIITDFVVAIILVVALFVGLIFFRSSIGKTASEIFEKRQTLSERSSAIGSLASFRKQYNERAETYLNVLYNVVPKKDELIDLSKNIQSLANEGSLGYGFSFLSETEAKPPDLGSISFKINVRGQSLETLFKFVDRLQTFRYLVSLSGINFDKRGAEISMDLRGDFYFR